MIPNIEKLVIGYLLDNQELTDLLGENKISSEVPPNATFPRLRISLSGGTVAVQRWLYAMRITVEAWADTKGDAFDAAVLALSVLESLPEAALVEEGIVTSSEVDAGLAWSPDPETDKPRYLGSVTIHIHPNPEA
jgi:hypothetical protein